MSYGMAMAYALKGLNSAPIDLKFLMPSKINRCRKRFHNLFDKFYPPSYEGLNGAFLPGLGGSGGGLLLNLVQHLHSGVPLSV